MVMTEETGTEQRDVSLYLVVGETSTAIRQFFWFHDID